MIKECEFCQNNFNARIKSRKFCSTKCANQRQNHVVVDDNKKTCFHCKQLKFLSEFNRSIERSSGYSSICRECQRKRRQDSPIDTRTRRGYHLKNNYGISLEQYESMIAEQNEVCFICKQPECYIDKRTGKPRALAVDYDHVTGYVRGLLCHKCNIAIGYFFNQEILDNAKLYLENHYGSTS